MVQIRCWMLGNLAKENLLIQPLPRWGASVYTGWSEVDRPVPWWQQWIVHRCRRGPQGFRARHRFGHRESEGAGKSAAEDALNLWHTRRIWQSRQLRVLKVSHSIFRSCESKGSLTDQDWPRINHHKNQHHTISQCLNPHIFHSFTPWNL